MWVKFFSEKILSCQYVAFVPYYLFIYMKTEQTMKLIFSRYVQFAVYISLKNLVSGSALLFENFGSEIAHSNHILKSDIWKFRSITFWTVSGIQKIRLKSVSTKILCHLLLLVCTYYNYKFICFWNFEFFYANYLV